jgi:shikimate kinase
MMGAGKSTVARLAARRLGWTWADTDSVVAEDNGASVAEIFARHGEARFRAEERRVLTEVLGRDEPLVVSVGGGAVLDAGNREAMRAAGTVVWLRARPETLIERVGDGAGRPLLGGPGPGDRARTLRRLDSERRPLYTEVAHEVIDVDELDADGVAERLIACAGAVAPDREART